jgi:hypothetical protein
LLSCLFVRGCYRCRLCAVVLTSSRCPHVQHAFPNSCWCFAIGRGRGLPATRDCARNLCQFRARRAHLAHVRNLSSNCWADTSGPGACRSVLLRLASPSGMSFTRQIFCSVYASSSRWSSSSSVLSALPANGARWTCSLSNLEHRHEYWVQFCYRWLLHLGLRADNLRLRKHAVSELAHYAKVR